jgi:hypothetical protein
MPDWRALFKQLTSLSWQEIALALYAGVVLNMEDEAVRGQDDPDVQRGRVLLGDQWSVLCRQLKENRIVRSDIQATLNLLDERLWQQYRAWTKRSRYGEVIR